ncbi:unnamed protein product [Mesocestoides corti]|uniref:Uncharacterized protein n=2 Tax=Mesocestoides corti TaxID=53468 RepID=A0A0R3UIM6_MESCO|nr:unnamed protein product [Mesocestoides corti]
MMSPPVDELPSEPSDLIGLISCRSHGYGSWCWEIIGVPGTTEASTVIFEESEGQSEYPNRSLKCSNYRKLPWLYELDLQEDLVSPSRQSIMPDRPRRNRSYFAGRNTASAATRESIYRIQNGDFHRINLASPVILATGSLAWKHANDIKVKLGSHCIYFNNSEYFKTAAKVIENEYNRKCEQQEKAREESEMSRMILQKVNSPSACCPPSFCSSSKSPYKISVWVPSSMMDRASSFLDVMRESGTSKPLFESRPWRKDDLEMNGLEEAGESSSTDDEMTVKEAYKSAFQLLSSHLSNLEKNVHFLLEHSESSVTSTD